uniref:Uncharacterized protein n=1 Tax=viral metagenome TaxID=1070528 RepID=A0A6M3K1T2_9ZZZZ
MTTIIHKSHVGKEDMKVQGNTDAAETFERLSSTGGSITLTKFPDIWDGTGQIIPGKILVKALDDNDTVLHSFGGVS